MGISSSDPLTHDEMTAVTCNFKYTLKNCSLTHSVGPFIVAGGLIIIYDVFAVKTERRVVEYQHATTHSSPMC